MNLEFMLIMLIMFLIVSTCIDEYTIFKLKQRIIKLENKLKE